MTLTRLMGCVLLILVGYHHINESLGFSTSGSIASAIFAICLISVYRGYLPERRNWIGWCAIAAGCLVLGNRFTIDLILILPLALIAMGIWLADLSFGRLHSYGDGGGAGGGACDTDGGGC